VTTLRRKLFGAGTSTIAAISLSLALSASPLAAQFTITTLTLSGQTITFPAPTATDYINGFVNSTGVTFTVKNLFSNQGAHTTTVLIRATSANLGGGKVLGDLQWRRSDLATWNSITAVDAQVEQRVLIAGTQNDPWTNTIFFRMVLSWATDAPATYTANYAITLSQTVP
jgi:hypothetical protein